MIIDQFGVFFDDTAAAASMTGKTVSLMPYAGREDSLRVFLLAKGANAATFTVRVQQSEDGATFTEAASFTMTKGAGTATVMNVPLPFAVKRNHIRLTADVSGTVAGVTLFAAVTGEHFAPYEDGLYAGKGGKAA
ncbi:MAG: hypothetical protein DELT_01724 [Desulfovibrio sp.]